MGLINKEILQKICGEDEETSYYSVLAGSKLEASTQFVEIWFNLEALPKFTSPTSFNQWRPILMMGIVQYFHY